MLTASRWSTLPVSVLAKIGSYLPVRTIHGQHAPFRPRPRRIARTLVYPTLRNRPDSSAQASSPSNSTTEPTPAGQRRSLEGRFQFTLSYTLHHLKKFPHSRRLLVRIHKVLDSLAMTVLPIEFWKRRRAYSLITGAYLDALQAIEDRQARGEPPLREQERERVEAAIKSILDRQLAEGIEFHPAVVADLLRVYLRLPGLAQPVVDKVLGQMGVSSDRTQWALLRMIADDPREHVDLESLIDQIMVLHGPASPSENQNPNPQNQNGHASEHGAGTGKIQGNGNGNGDGNVNEKANQKEHRNGAAKWASEAWVILQLSQIRRGQLKTAFHTFETYLRSPDPDPSALVHMADRLLFAWMKRRPTAQRGDRSAPRLVAEALAEHFGGIDRLPMEFVVVWARAEWQARNYRLADELDQLVLASPVDTPQYAEACEAYLNQLRFNPHGPATSPFEAARHVIALVPLKEQRTPELLNSLLSITLHPPAHSRIYRGRASARTTTTAAAPTATIDSATASTTASTATGVAEAAPAAALAGSHAANLPLVLTILRLLQYRGRIVPATPNAGTIDTTISGLVKLCRRVSYLPAELFPPALRSRAAQCANLANRSVRWRQKHRILWQEWELFADLLRSIEVERHAASRRGQHPDPSVAASIHVPMSPAIVASLWAAARVRKRALAHSQPAQPPLSASSPAQSPALSSVTVKHVNMVDHPTIKGYTTVLCTPRPNPRPPIEALVILVERWIKVFLRSQLPAQSARADLSARSDLAKDGRAEDSDAALDTNAHALNEDAVEPGTGEDQTVDGDEEVEPSLSTDRGTDEDQEVERQFRAIMAQLRADLGLPLGLRASLRARALAASQDGHGPEGQQAQAVQEGEGVREGQEGQEAQEAQVAQEAQAFQEGQEVQEARG